MYFKETTSLIFPKYPIHVLLCDTKQYFLMLSVHWFVIVPLIGLVKFSIFALNPQFKLFLFPMSLILCCVFVKMIMIKVVIMVYIQSLYAIIRNNCYGSDILLEYHCQLTGITVDVRWSCAVGDLTPSWFQFQIIFMYS